MGDRYTHKCRFYRPLHPTAQDIKLTALISAKLGHAFGGSLGWEEGDDC